MVISQQAYIFNCFTLANYGNVSCHTRSHNPLGVWVKAIIIIGEYL